MKGLGMMALGKTKENKKSWKRIERHWKFIPVVKSMVLMKGMG